MIFRGGRSSDLDGQRKSDMLRELQDTHVALSRIRSKLQSTGRKAQYTALAKSQLVRGFRSKPTITIVRNGAKGNETLIANEDFELQPGDVVEGCLAGNPWRRAARPIAFNRGCSCSRTGQVLPTLLGYLLARLPDCIASGAKAGS